MTSSSGDAQAGGQGRRIGRPPALSEQHLRVLRELVSASPGASLEAVTRQLGESCGVRVCSLTVRRALQAAGIVRVKPTRRTVSTDRAAAPPRRYGYTAAHRREAIGRDYSCCLTDAEWALVADLFERPAGGRDAPAQLERRVLVEACSPCAAHGLCVALAAQDVCSVDCRV